MIHLSSKEKAYLKERFDEAWRVEGEIVQNDWTPMQLFDQVISDLSIKKRTLFPLVINRHLESVGLGGSLFVRALVEGQEEEDLHCLLKLADQLRGSQKFDIDTMMIDYDTDFQIKGYAIEKEIQEKDDNDRFSLKEEEYFLLEGAFVKLCHKAAWQAKRSYDTLIFEDVDQDIQIAMFRAGKQYKKKMFFQRSFEFLDQMGLKNSHLINAIRKSVLNSRGPKEEEELISSLIDFYNGMPGVPKTDDPLILDEHSSSYIKTCIWNQQKCILKDQAKECANRKGEVSLSEDECLIGDPASYDEIHVNSVSRRERMFYNIKEKLLGTDKKAADTYKILVDPKNNDEVFSRTSQFKVKLNGVRRRTKKSYKAIEKEIGVIQQVIEEEMKVGDDFD